MAQYEKYTTVSADRANTCSHCGNEFKTSHFGFGSGHDFSGQMEAKAQLVSELLAPSPLPCPHCGMLPASVARRRTIKNKIMWYIFTVAVFGLGSFAVYSSGGVRPAILIGSFGILSLTISHLLVFRPLDFNSVAMANKRKGRPGADGSWSSFDKGNGTFTLRTTLALGAAGAAPVCLLFAGTPPYVLPVIVIIHFLLLWTMRQYSLAVLPDSEERRRSTVLEFFQGIAGVISTCGLLLSVVIGFVVFVTNPNSWEGVCIIFGGTALSIVLGIVVGVVCVVLMALLHLVKKAD